MRRFVIAALAWAVLLLDGAPAPDPVYAPLWQYQGTWTVSRSNGAPGAKPEELKNQCALLGKYFTCSQTVNGQQAGLVIYLPTGTPGHYYVQNVRVDGLATGRGNLEIAGDRLTYSNVRDDSGRTVYHRILNVFNGKNRIHFENAESNDEKNWKVTASGDEVRTEPRRQ